MIFFWHGKMAEFIFCITLGLYGDTVPLSIGPTAVNEEQGQHASMELSGAICVQAGAFELWPNHGSIHYSSQSAGQTWISQQQPLSLEQGGSK